MFEDFWSRRNQAESKEIPDENHEEAIKNLNDWLVTLEERIEAGEIDGISTEELERLLLENTRLFKATDDGQEYERLSDELDQLRGKETKIRDEHIREHRDYGMHDKGAEDHERLDFILIEDIKEKEDFKIYKSFKDRIERIRDRVRSKRRIS